MLVFVMAYVYLTIGLYEDKRYRMPYGFLDPEKSAAPAVYLALCLAHVVFFVLAWALANARARARDSGSKGYCAVFWCGPPSMCATASLAAVHVEDPPRKSALLHDDVDDEESGGRAVRLFSRDASANVPTRLGSVEKVEYSSSLVMVSEV